MATRNAVSARGSNTFWTRFLESGVSEDFLGSNLSNHSGRTRLWGLLSLSQESVPETEK
jgi:hypothetical protein